MITNEQFKDGVALYHQQKPVDDIDLVSEVRTMLMESGLGQRIEAYDNNEYIVKASGKMSVVQRDLLNCYWTYQLNTAKATSIEERYCLIPNGEIKDWLRLFKEIVLPFVIANNLPN